MSINLALIEPGHLYSFAEAAALIPSSHPGKKLHPRTLHRWRVEGRLAAVPRGRNWFVVGKELLRLLGADKPQDWQGVTPAERVREAASDEAKLRAMGVIE